MEANADLGRPVSYEGPDRLLVMGHSLPMKRAVSNLIENGLKYGNRVNVRLLRAGDKARLLIEDEGPGIPEAELEHVIAPFVRLDEARGRDTSGLGLGLAIVAKAVEREQGALRLSNRPTGGLQAEILPAGQRG